MACRAEIEAMKYALALARRGKGETFPNPMVGAVVLDPDGNRIGDGFHRKCGAPHAEAVAIASSAGKAEGGTLVVTLEPCCHQGRTGPCTEEIIRAGIRRVVAAMEDPAPQVCGGGIDRLRSAGIDVETGLLAAEAARLNKVYLRYLETGRSWVTLKMALTLDGRTAAADGTSRWISCEESRKRVHAKRASVQAVMTGAGTIRRDDPELSVRMVPVPPGGHPVRIAVTSSGDFGESERFLSAPGRVIVAIPEGVLTEGPSARSLGRAEIWEFPPRSGGGFDLEPLLRRTASEGFGEILCEAGSGLSTAFLREGLADSMMLFTAPAILGCEGAPAFRDLGIATIGKALRLENCTFRRSGSDFMTEGDIVHGSRRR